MTFWQQKGFGRGRTRKPPGKMNKLEEKYSHKLANDPDVIWFKYEGITLKLASDTRYTPDFVVMKKDFSIEFHETKGFWEDKAKIKIKVAADLFPFKFIAIKDVKNQWMVEEF